jgi:hypothetical protein
MRRHVKTRIVSVLAVAALLVGVAWTMTACSPAEVKDRAVLSAALTKFSASAVPLAMTIQAVDPNSTVAPDGQPVATSLRAGRDAIVDNWQKVIDAAKKVDGADAAAAETVWTELDAAIDSVPDGATAAEAGAIVGDPVNALLQVQADLWAVVKSG